PDTGIAKRWARSRPTATIAADLARNDRDGVARELHRDRPRVRLHSLARRALQAHGLRVRHLPAVGVAERERLPIQHYLTARRVRRGDGALEREVAGAHAADDGVER